MDNETIVERNLSISHLILVLISSLLIGFGLSGDDIFLNIAVSGPLIIIGLSGIPLLFAIESRHMMSEKIDNTLSEVPGLSTNGSQNKVFIQLLFFFSCLILLLLSTLFLSERDYIMFSFTLFMGCCIFGVVVGRSFGKNIHENSKPDTFSNLDELAKQEEYLHFKKWLSGDLRDNLSSIQSRKMEEQKLYFLKETQKITSDDLRIHKLMNELKSAINEPGKVVNNITEKLFVDIYGNCHNNWLDGLLKFNEKDAHVRESIQALLLLPSLFELMHMLSRKGGARDDLVFNHLLSCVGVFASRLQQLDVVIQGSDNVSNDAIFVEDIDESIQSCVSFASMKACQFELYDFSPWWLLNFRCLLLSMGGSHKDELSPRISARLSFVNSHQEDWCFSLSEYFSGNVDMDHSISESAEMIARIKEEGSGIFENELVGLTWHSHKSSR